MTHLLRPFPGPECLPTSQLRQPRPHADPSLSVGLRRKYSTAVSVAARRDIQRGERPIELSSSCSALRRSTPMSGSAMLGCRWTWRKGRCPERRSALRADDRHAEPCHLMPAIPRCHVFRRSLGRSGSRSRTGWDTLGRSRTRLLGQMLGRGEALFWEPRQCPAHGRPFECWAVRPSCGRSWTAER